LKKLIYISCLLSFALSSCDLDDFMFNASQDISEYKLDDYEGEVEIEVGPAYDIDEDKVHLFKLPKTTERDFDLWAVYIGDTSHIRTDSVIVYCHGNRDHMDFYWPRAKLLANTGGKNRYGVLMMDYQGFGLSGGESSEIGMREDVEEALAWLSSKGLRDARTIIYGFSLGGNPAVYHAANNTTLNPSILILESTFASLEVLAQDGSGLAIPGEMLANAKYDLAEQIKSVYQPFLHFHGVDDSFLPMKSHGDVIHKNYAGTRSEYIQVEGAEHGDLPYVMGYEAYLESIFEFISGS